ncbi:transmembrane protein, putative, partial [Bodo saltans]
SRSRNIFIVIKYKRGYMGAPIKQLRRPTSRLVRLLLSFVVMSSAVFHLAASQQLVVVPPTRGFVEHTYDPTSNMTTTTHTFRLAYIASEVTPIIQLLAEHQRASVEQKIAENVLQIQGGNSNTLVVGNATTIINVTTSVLALRAVPNANVLFEEGIMHTTFVDGLNVAVIAEAPNITFTTFQQPMNIKMIDDYPNMEVVLLPIQQVAFEAGLLASAIVLQSFTIAIMYSHFYRDSINGLRNAVVQACPQCFVKAFGVCSGSFECPGQWDQFIAFAGNADVVITGAHVSDLLPTMVFRFNKYNATKLGLPKKYVIVIGDVLNNIGSAVKSNPYFMGVVRIQLDATLSNVVEGLVHNNFTATVRTAPSAWDRSFTNASMIYPGVTKSHLAQFVLNVQLFKWGTFTPVYDAIDKAAEDADRIGGLPFVPIGDI